MTQFNTRFLTIDDFFDIEVLFNSQSKIMGFEKTAEFSSKFLSDMRQAMTGPYLKVVGVYENNILKGTVGGHFNPQFNFWLITRSLVESSTGLNSFRNYSLIFDAAITPLIEYAEQNNFYSFYSCRHLKQVSAHYKIRKSAENDEGLFQNFKCGSFRYDQYDEAVYGPHEKPTINLHNFFYGEHLKPVTTLITHWVLKQKYRQQILSQKNYEYKEVVQSIFPK
jgi:hypothetical protein